MRSIRPRTNVVFKRGVKTPTIDWKPIRSSTANVQDAENKTKSPIFRKVLLGLMIAMPVISFGLGCWQVKRLNWKNNLISKSEQLLAKPPLTKLPPDLDPVAIKDYEFRRFRIKGKFDYSQEMFLGPRIRNGVPGYLVVTPFIRKDGGDAILVERGWISKEKVIPSTRENSYLSHLALPKGEVEIEAMFRAMPDKSSLQFDHQQDTRLFLIPDVKAMASQSGALPIYAQMIYDLKDHPEYKKSESSSWNILKNWKKDDDEKKLFKDDFELQFQEFEFIKNGVPIGTIPKVNFTNNHLQYLVTWFGVSVTSAGLLAYSMYKGKNFSSAERIIEAKRKDMSKNW